MTTEPVIQEPAKRIRVASVDDDTVIRHGLPVLLEHIHVAGSYADVGEFLTAKVHVDVVLLDLVLTGAGRPGVIQGAAAIRAVVTAGHRVLIYTNERRRAVLVACLAAGAFGVVHKAEPISALEDAIHAVADGEVVITQALVGLAELVERQGELPALSARQRQVLSGRARGEPFQSIADRLYISRKTAEEYMAAVNSKFAEFLRDHSAADLERHLGIAPGDVLEQLR